MIDCSESLETNRFECLCLHFWSSSRHIDFILSSQPSELFIHWTLTQWHRLWLAGDNAVKSIKRRLWLFFIMLCLLLRCVCTVGILAALESSIDLQRPVLLLEMQELYKILLLLHSRTLGHLRHNSSFARNDQFHKTFCTTYLFVFWVSFSKIKVPLLEHTSLNCITNWQ